MDLPSNRDKGNYWSQRPDMNPTSKTHIKLNIDQQNPSQFVENAQFYTDNNSLKRNLSIADQRLSPLKKRPFSEQTALPVQTDDDDDDDDDNDNDEEDSNTGTVSSKTNNGPKRDDNRRRAAHTAAEQKRRNAIRKGYDALQSLVPNSHLLDPISSQKVSKAAILKRSTDYLAQLNKETQQLSSQLEAKKTETICLRVLQKAYEDILEMNMKSNKNAGASIDDEQKFKVFQSISDALFVTFDQAMESGQVTNFPQFTSIIIRWIEDSCRPTDINDIIHRIIGNSKS